MRIVGGISERIVKPANCAFTLGIPSSEEEFWSGRSEFAKSFNGVWSRYYYEVIRHVDKYEPVYKALGVTFKRRITLQGYSELFREKEIDVIIHLSHSEGDQLEFADGLFGPAEIIRAIPDHLFGIADLTACKGPESLVKTLHNERSSLIVKWLPVDATAYVWLYFFSQLFGYLYQNNTNYIDAHIALEKSGFE